LNAESLFGQIRLKLIPRTPEKGFADIPNGTKLGAEWRFHESLT